MIDVTLVKGNKSLFTKKLKYENTADEIDIKLQFQFETKSIV